MRGHITDAFDRVTDTLTDVDNLIGTLDVLDTLNEMVTGVHPILRCPPACSRCCHQQIVISEEEWALVLAHLHAHLSEADRRRIVRTAHKLCHPKTGLLAAALRQKTREAFDEELNRVLRRRVTPCVLLTADGRCSVYPVRPMICRAYGRVATAPDKPMLCMIFNERLQAQQVSPLELEMPDYAPVALAYFRSGPPDVRYAVLPAFVAYHDDGTGDLVTEVRPLPRDGADFPVLTRAEARITS
ncbi:MAG: YkgJ family cysteine cluster protein [Actinobacteria bacterium]|nr:YkgJ family cysteine cluster protein [Actinomycetota bacterium]